MVFDMQEQPRRKGKYQSRSLTRDILEYGAFRILSAFLTTLPESVALGMGRRIADLYYHLDKKRRNLAFRNINMILGLSPESEDAKRIARGAFRNLIQVIIESLRMPQDLLGPAGKRVFKKLEGREKVEKALADGRGLIFITGHTGNWELMGAYTSSTVVPITAVSRPARNRFLSRLYVKQRERYRQKMVLKKGALLKIARVLREGRVAAFLVDQYPGSEEVKVDFMGVPAHTHSTPAALAVRFQVPIVAGFCYRTGTGFEYEGYFEDPIYPDPERDAQEEVLRLTKCSNEAIERFIRAHPEQWLWMHRRWR
ncbi:MAG: lysophospholipid acyltransferase family protein [Planctomycetota bacterium]